MHSLFNKRISFKLQQNRSCGKNKESIYLYYKTSSTSESLYLLIGYWRLVTTHQSKVVKSDWCPSLVIRCTTVHSLWEKLWKWPLWFHGFFSITGRVSRALCLFKPGDFHESAKKSNFFLQLFQNLTFEMNMLPNCVLPGYGLAIIPRTQFGNMLISALAT